MCIQTKRYMDYSSATTNQEQIPRK